MIDFARTEATDLLKTNDGPRDRTQYEPNFHQSAVGGSWQSAVPGSGRFLELLTADRQLPTDFDRTEATDLLKTNDGTPGPNPIRTHFHRSAVGSWQSEVPRVGQVRGTADRRPPTANRFWEWSIFNRQFFAVRL